MDNVNLRFFEAFKHLDKLLSDGYGVSHGVTHYIDTMKATAPNVRYQVSGWEADLKQLTSLRHKRNLLSHSTSFDETLSTQADIDWLNHFYTRIMQQNDPLAQAAKVKAGMYKPKVQITKPVPQHPVTPIRQTRCASKETAMTRRILIAFIVVLAMILALGIGIVVAPVF